jgi:hypothetical protein
MSWVKLGGSLLAMSKVTADRNLGSYIFEKYVQDLDTLKQVLGLEDKSYCSLLASLGGLKS